jgi:hypothetical protein
MSPPKVFIILLTYNMREEARRCLRSLRALDVSNHCMVLVDNGSQDGVIDMAHAEFPEVFTIQTGKNLGYTGGNNRGLEYAIANGADYMLILNPDTVLANPGFLEETVSHMESHPAVGIAGPRVFGPEKGMVQNTVLFAPSLWRNMVHWVRYRINPCFAERSGNSVLDVDVLNGVCIVVRAACLRQIGLFDPDMFMYIEDVEMDHRAHLHGWRVQYLPIDSVVHCRRSGDCHSTSTVNFLLKRNTVYFLQKVGRSVEAWAYAVISLAMIAACAFWPPRQSRASQYLHFCRRLSAAYWQILRGSPYSQAFGPPYGP